MDTSASTTSSPTTNGTTGATTSDTAPAGFSARKRVARVSRRQVENEYPIGDGQATTTIDDIRDVMHTLGTLDKVPGRAAVTFVDRNGKPVQVAGLVVRYSETEQ